MSETNFIQYLNGIPKKYYIANKFELPGTKILAPGKFYSPIPNGVLNGRGILTTALLVTTSPDLELQLQYDEKNYTATVSEVNTSGFTFYIPRYPFVTEYGPQYYTVVWVANREFSDNVRAQFVNTGSSDLVIAQLIMEIYQFNPGFYSALARVKAGEELIPQYIDPSVQVKAPKP